MLQCNVRECAHNKDEKCKLESIKVEGRNATRPEETECASFEISKEFDCRDGKCCGSDCR